jgi:hypothetical protein
VTDAADGGIADRGGGRGSYRVIDINAGQILQLGTSLRRALSPTFPAGAMVFFIPSRGGAEDVAEGSGAGQSAGRDAPRPSPRIP